MLRRWAVLIYGVGCYLLGISSVLYGIGFVGNVLTPTSLDAPAEGSLAGAVLVNVALLLAFGLQHSVMARPWFKRWWTRLVPAEVERSTYVLFSALALTLLFWQWRPMGGVVWDVEGPLARAVLYALFACGWVIMLGTTFLINHFDLFGLRQVWLYFRGEPYTSSGFVTPWPYRMVRHPLYVGWMIAFWVTPTMTLAHALFAAGLTVYILVAVYFEERDLVEAFGRTYAEYRERVPMLVPFWPRSGAKRATRSHS
jgi:protein-S-isoprenylcysteine O-methyltransferase Ste14